MCQSTDLFQLNDYIRIYIQSNGITYVTNNYIQLREDYYNKKESNVDTINTNESRE
jgi:hypothetical protein